MRIEVTTQNAVTVIKPHGQLDAESGPILQDALLRLANAEVAAVTLDLSAVPRISSAGLAAWWGELPTILQQSPCTIVGMRPKVHRFLEQAGVLRLVEMLRSCRSQAGTT